MELKEFVKSTLKQLVEAVKEAQDECLEHGALINPMLEVPRSNSPNAEFNSKYYPATTINFQVGLTSIDADTKNKGIGVFLGSVKFGADKEEAISSKNITHIEFSINTIMPYVGRKGKRIDISNLFH